MRDFAKHWCKINGWGFLLWLGIFLSQSAQAQLMHSVMPSLQKTELPPPQDSMQAYQDQIQVLNIKLNNTQNALQEMDRTIQNIQSQIHKNTKKVQVTQQELNRFWVLMAAVLVFFMQAGFKAFEMGMVRKIHGNGIGMKNIIDWLMICIIYFLVGFGFMFGQDSWGLIGCDLFAPAVQGLEKNVSQHTSDLGIEFLLFQLAFAATAATIVSGAMSERTALVPYLFTATFIGVVIYPVFGHWVWGKAYYANNAAWLADWGFLDFAGSTVVHSVGAWVSLTGIWFLGPRLGRYDENGHIDKEKFKSFSLGYSALGLFILWFGWWGFNGGSYLAYEKAEIGSIILNTNIAGAFAGITAFFHSYLLDRENIYEKLLGGILGGLVAITACCNVVSPAASMLIGVLAGVIHNHGFDLLIKLRLDDPVGAIPVHGFCGVWGTLCVGLFGSIEKLQELTGREDWTQLSQIGIQLFGIVIAFLFTTSLSYVFFSVVKTIYGLRVDPIHETTTGYTIVPLQKKK